MSTTLQAPTKLAIRLEKFCQHIIGGSTQSDAYRAVYNTKGMSPAVVHNKASALAKSDEVRVRLEELLVPVKAQTKLTLERWHEELDRCALGDVRKMFDTHGNPIDIHALGDEEAPCIAGFEILEEFEGKGEDRTPIGYTRKYKLVDKLKALELAGKSRGYYVEKNKVDLTLTVEHLVTLMNQHAPKVINVDADEG